MKNRSYHRKKAEQETYQRIERQRWKYNLLGILVIIIILLLVFDPGGLVSKLAHFLTIHN